MESHTEIQEKDLLGDGFLEEAWAYDDHFVFSFIPLDPNTTADYYFSYEVKENGTILENANKIFYENVSTDRPIVIEFPRKTGSVYKIEVLIENKDGVEVHRSKTRMGDPQTQEA